MKRNLWKGVIGIGVVLFCFRPVDVLAKNIPDIVKNCTVCHGEDGSGVGPEYPAIAKQNEVYIRSEFAAYQSRARHNPGAEYMYGAMSDLNEEEMKTVIQYFSNQSPVGADVGDKVLLAKGQEIYMKGVPSKKVKSCVGCHGDAGEGNDDAPRVASLSVYYQTVQYKAFKAGTREEATVMPMIYKNLSDEDQKAVATYLSSLK